MAYISVPTNQAKKKPSAWLPVILDTESYGMNCQACVNNNLEFTYFGIVMFGSMNNNISYPMAPGLKEVFGSLYLACYGVTDAPCILSEHILIP